MSHLCSHCNSFLMEDYVWWVSAGKTSTPAGDVRSVGLQSARNALNLLANQQEDGDGVTQRVFTNLCEQERSHGGFCGWCGEFGLGVFICPRTLWWE